MSWFSANCETENDCPLHPSEQEEMPKFSTLASETLGSQDKNVVAAKTATARILQDGLGITVTMLLLMLQAEQKGVATPKRMLSLTN